MKSFKNAALAFTRSLSVHCAIICVALSAALFATAARASDVEDVSRARMMEVVANHNGPVVIEFYNPNDTGDECKAQPPVYDEAAAEYKGRVVFLRFDIRQDQALAVALRATVCPTFLFMDHNQPEPNRLSRRIWGFLSKAQFEELMQEFYQIAP